MDTQSTEQDRQVAIQRHLAGERVCDLCKALGHSRSWFYKWWGEYRNTPTLALADHSRAPHTSPQTMPAAVIQAVVAVRRVLEAAATPATRYGLIGAGAIRQQLEQMHVAPLPSLPTIQRILQDAGLTHPIGAGKEAAYYPWLEARAVNDVQATDLISRRICGGAEIQNLHTIDHYSHAVYLSQHADKSRPTVQEHLLGAWSTLGLPALQQFDNEDTFRGGHTHPHVIGQVVRLCLFCGIEPLFTPYYEPQRNYQIETFHSLWDRAFWSRHEFRDLAEVRAEAPCFAQWYHTAYRPPTLQGKTPAQMRRGARGIRLSGELRALIPKGRLPITAGWVHFRRKVEATAEIDLLNETWYIGRKWIGEYVHATINTTNQVITFWHKPDAASSWQLIKTRPFRIPEPVQPLHPAFRRKCPRCRDCLPD